MIDSNLIIYMDEQLRHTPTEFYRYMYHRIIWDDQMIGIVGPRGVGKSTMVKQYIMSQNDKDKWLYVSADHSYFAGHSIAGLADELVREGYKHLAIDEIHKYEGWSKELKQIYDIHPDLQIIFTASSILDINSEQADLSRRVLIFKMQGLSFREYLQLFHNIALPVYSLEDIIAHKVALPPDFHPLPYFRSYLKAGYYPFANRKGFDIRLQQIISLTLEVDVPQFAGMNVATSRKLKRLLALISAGAPFKPNITSLASELSVSKNDLPKYIAYMEMAGMIGALRDDTGGMRALGKVEKIYIDNPNLMYALQGSNVNIGNVRETFFYNQMRLDDGLTSSKTSDFKIGDRIFEIGGHAKGKKQLEGNPNGIVVRDDMEAGAGAFVPLWAFGLTY